MSPGKKQKVANKALEAGFRIGEEKHPGRRFYVLRPLKTTVKVPQNNCFGNYQEIKDYLDRIGEKK